MISGKKAIITGADRGLGKETAALFVEKGATVVICSRNIDRLNQVREEIGSDRVFCIRADMSVKEDVDKLFDYAADKMGSIDIVVNNAGIQGPIGRFEDNDWEEWEKVIAVNLMGPAYCMKKAIGIFKAEGRGGKIINLSGGGATSGRPFFSGYATAKCGIVKLTEILAEENKEYGIDINAIAPGIMNTEMLREVVAAGKERSGSNEYDKALSMGEEGMESLKKPSELIAFLASDKSDGISGKLISAVWDGWDRDDFASVCEDRNIYTLRRVVE